MDRVEDLGSEVVVTEVIVGLVMEGSEVTEIVGLCGRLARLRGRWDLMLLYPHPRGCFSCEVLRMTIQVRLPQVWSVGMNACAWNVYLGGCAFLCVYVMCVMWVVMCLMCVDVWVVLMCCVSV